MISIEVANSYEETSGVCAFEIVIEFKLLADIEE